MTSIVLQIDVAAAPERCFDLARSMDFHTHSMGLLGTAERIVGGVAHGLLRPGEEVEFEARHLGMVRRMRARITAFDRPRTFADAQVRGPFRELVHTHRFEPLPDGRTRVTDTITIAVKRWQLGVLAERLIVAPHLRRLVAGHQANLKRMLESDEADRFLSA